MSVLETALHLATTGHSIIPIRPDGSKAPLISSWRDTMHHGATPDQITTWWTRWPDADLAVVHGTVSGNLEMIEIEGRAAHHVPALRDLAHDSGAGPLWDRIMTGWLEQSPTGGIHIHVRLTDMPVPGNTKIARDTDGHVTAETRGEGGYAVVAPSRHHPNGRAWTRLIGGPETAAQVTADERDTIIAIIATLDETPENTPENTPAPAPHDPTAGITPGDDFENRTDWADILTPHGWTHVHTQGHTRYWRRPGKTIGISATTGRNTDRDRLYVFTSSTDFTPEVPYTKLGAYAVLNHNGDMHAAARTLRQRGYGTPTPEPTIPLTQYTTNTTGNLATVTPLPTPQQRQDRPLELIQERTLERSDDANALKLINTHGTTIRHIPERGRWIHWNGHRWEWQPQNGGTIRELAKRVARTLPDRDQADVSHKKKALSAQGITNMLIQAATDERITIPYDQLDNHPTQLNTPGGIIDLTTGQLTPSNPDLLHTRTTTITPDPTMPTPHWDAFLAETFAGHPELAPYIQRLAGYAATGHVTHHILPFLYGSGANGKSVFLDVLRAILGDYAATSPSNFLMASTSQHETEIARLSGLRTVITSEINQESRFDEAKVKLLTGGDALTARFMRQDHFTFTPTHHLWLMGNSQPKVTAGGPSFWRRLRLIPFTNTVPPEKRNEDLADQLIQQEAPGILAWIIQGAVNVHTNGLQDPTIVMAATQAYAAEEDHLARFIDDRAIINTHMTVPTNELRAAYTEWCKQEGETPLNQQNFGRQLRARYNIDQRKSNGRRIYTGLGLQAPPDAPETLEEKDEYWR